MDTLTGGLLFGLMSFPIAISNSGPQISMISKIKKPPLETACWQNLQVDQELEDYSINNHNKII